MTTVGRFSGKNLGAVNHLQVTEQSNVIVLNEPTAPGVTVSTSINVADGDQVVDLYGSIDAMGFDSPQTETPNGPHFAPVVKMKVAKIDSVKGANLHDMLRRKLFVIVNDNNGNRRILGSMKDGEDVTLLLTETTGNQAGEYPGYELTFLWESDHMPWFYSIAES